MAKPIAWCLVPTIRFVVPFAIDPRAEPKGESAHPAGGVLNSQAATAREFGIDEQTSTSRQRRCPCETLTSSVNIAVFNLGNAISASVGSIALSAFGIGAITWAEAAFPLAVIGIALIAKRNREKSGSGIGRRPPSSPG